MVEQVLFTHQAAAVTVQATIAANVVRFISDGLASVLTKPQMYLVGPPGIHGFLSADLKKRGYRSERASCEFDFVDGKSLRL